MTYYIAFNNDIDIEPPWYVFYATVGEMGATYGNDDTMAGKTDAALSIKCLSLCDPNGITLENMVEDLKQAINRLLNKPPPSDVINKDFADYYDGLVAEYYSELEKIKEYLKHRRWEQSSNGS